MPRKSPSLTKLVKDKLAANAEAARAARSETIPATRPDADALQLPDLIDRQKLLKLIPLSYVTILELIKQDKFPRSHDLFGKNVWYGSEVAKVINNLPLRRIRSDRT
jgi:predicted DNA-binding transcriptional regulator AlpA